MSLTEGEWLVVAILCTISMLIGWLSGNRERRTDEEIIAGEDWARHWSSVMFVTRPTLPPADDTVPGGSS